MIFARILFYVSLITSLAFLVSGYGYQWSVWELGTGFTILRYSAYAAVGLLLVNAISLFFLKNARFKTIMFVAVGAFLTGSVSGVAYYWQHEASSAPPIHDITTDLQEPPEFSAMVRLREDAPNPPEYAGEETAGQQREHYPDIAPLMTDVPLQEVMDHAVMLVTDRGWTLVSINRQEGRIEATETLAWFGFKDDVVLRFRESNEGTRVDMRSKSRIGRGDVGVNAKRINNFLEDLEDRLD